MNCKFVKNFNYFDFDEYKDVDDELIKSDEDNLNLKINNINKMNIDYDDYNLNIGTMDHDYKLEEKNDKNLDILPTESDLNENDLF